ncbi:hypothetical protein [Natronorubrum daqingense]|nr:hypothetical protein [Natronorubrum daqingense]SIS06108.1 hypothetical protein SAMN05421809_3638 [Natronorubrum daqingense]
MPETECEQAPLPGLEPGKPTEWLVTVTDAGLEYAVLVEAMSRNEARETFKSEFEMFELGVEDDEFDWDHETVFARTEENAEQIALAREREYMRVYDSSNLGNTATVEAVVEASEADGWATRRARREADEVDR